jgi:hypothetical protein
MNTDFIKYADKGEVEKVHEFWANMKRHATNSGKSSQGIIDGGHHWATIHGLQSEAGKKLNGRVGLVLQEELNDQGRYQVQVDGIKGIKLIQPANLTDLTNDELVRTYRIPAQGEGETHQVVLFPKNHSMFTSMKDNSPALALCGVPLVVKKVKPKKSLSERADYDNRNGQRGL